MSTAMDRIIDIYTTVVLVGLVLLAPYTKVEESFNMQAVHDFLYHGTDLQAYDHVEFPGVVPRTFLGSLVLAVSSWPTVRLMDLTMGHLQDNRILSLYVVRGTMAVIAAAALRRLRNACPASSKPALPVVITLCVTGCFHLSFYYTRLLPNSFGLILSTYSLALYIEGKTLTAMQVMTFTALVFRCDLLAISLALGIEVIAREVIQHSGGARTLITSVVVVKLSALKAAVYGVVLSIPLDTLMWQRGMVMWPEGWVFWFNAVENKSYLWGTQPWHWYLTNATIRGLGPLLLLLPLAALGPPVGASDKQVLPLLPLIMVWYVAPVSVLSLLPHKEIRFIFPSLLALAVVAACGAYRLLQYLSPQARRYGPEAYNSKAAKIMALMARNRVLRTCVLRSGLIGIAIVTVVLFGARAAASIYNYPSGYAMQQLSKVVMRSRPDGAILAGRDNPAHPLLLGRFNVSSALPVVVENAELAGRDASHSDKKFWVELIGEGDGLEGQCVIHVDVFSAMSGVSRFVHPINTICTVDKTEGLQWTDRAAMSRYSFLMSERHDTPPSEEFELLFSTLGYHRFTLLPLPSVIAIVIHSSVAKERCSSLQALRPQVFVYRNRHRTKIVYDEEA
ncbi:hypothetical protein FOZ62_005206 [Perkinsus olseni]|uniref:Mannosyltransferase n=1 Tax=Perkinsus olseni TaxID=32597 RepID=A0A7J6PXH0_PEROL|nr:hypothetical protein FOZ62_005206 [Perkinsus olseni]